MTAKNGSGSLRERIRKSEVKGKPFTVEGWDEKVELRSMTVAEKVDLVGEGDDVSAAQTAEILPKVIVLTCYDPDTGEPVFSNGDEEWLATQPAAVVEPLALAGLKASGLDESALDEAKKDS